MRMLPQGDQSGSWAVAGKGGKRAARRTVLSTPKRRERRILPPAGAGPRGAGLRPAPGAADRGRE